MSDRLPKTNARERQRLEHRVQKECRRLREEIAKLADKRWSRARPSLFDLLFDWLRGLFGLKRGAK
jgi:hypothetical protein